MVVVVAITIAYFAPFGSAALQFAQFLFWHVAPVLGGVLGISAPAGVLGPGGTPVWNPNAGTGLLSSRWRQFVFHQNGEEGIDVIRTVTNACKNGNPYPNCGHWYSRLARAVAGGIGVAIAMEHVAYQNLAAQEQRFGGWFLRRMDEGSPKIQIGTYPNGEPIYMGLAVGGLSRSSGAIVFGHGARHLAATGLSEELVNQAIRSEVRDIAQGGRTGTFWGRVVVNGRTVEYRAFTLPNGTINVGTYYVRR